MGTRPAGSASAGRRPERVRARARARGGFTRVFRARRDRRYQPARAWLLPSMHSRPGFLFPGQGSESVGMGTALHGADPERFERWIGHAEAASGLALRHAVLMGPA